MRDWVEVHGTANLRKSTFMSYKSHLKNHVYPHIGYIPLEQLTPGTLDKLYRKLSENGLSPSSVKYAHRIISVALEQARKYHYIGTNPARDIITKFGKQGKTPDPYTIEQMRVLLDKVEGTPWELIIVLGGLYGLRLGEILGLRWRSINLENRTLSVVEQLPYAISRTQTDITEMAPVKSSERELPITESTLPYFQRQIALQAQQKQMFDKAYHENDLVISKADGSPDSRDRVSDGFRQLLGHLGLPRMRFHDTRHTAATNMHELTGDFFTVSQILGHSTKGIGNHLNVDGISSVTAVYVSVRNERKQAVLDAYHTAIHK
jgi:integrase